MCCEVYIFLLNSKYRAERQRKSLSTFKAAQVPGCLVSVKWWCSCSFKWWIWIRPSWSSFRLSRRGALYWRYSLIHFDVLDIFCNVRKKNALCGHHVCAAISVFMFMKCIVSGNSRFSHPPIYETFMTLLRITKFYSFGGPYTSPPLNFWALLCAMKSSHSASHVSVE